MFNFPHYKRDANQNYTKIFFSPQLKWPHSRAKTTTNAGEDVAKQEPSYIVSGNANYYNHYGKQYGDLSKS
jgi:hypothetical protein